MTGSRDDEVSEHRRGRKAPTAFRTISEVADELHIPQHVLRFWETKFPQLAPLKRGGGRRYYRPEDVDLLRRISDLLYIQGYTIKGVQRLLRDGTVGEAEPAATEREEDEAPRPQLALPGLPQPPGETSLPVTKPVVRVRAEAARAPSVSSPGPARGAAGSGGDRSVAIRSVLTDVLGELRAIRSLLGGAIERRRLRARD